MFYEQLAKEFFDFMLHTKPPPLDEPANHSRGRIGILIYLHAINDGATPGDLSQHFSVSTGRIATALKGLEKEGLLERRTDAEDKRKVTVYITERGKSVLLEKHDQMVRKFARELSKLEEDEAIELIRLLKKFMADTKTPETEKD